MSYPRLIAVRLFNHWTQIPKDVKADLFTIRWDDFLAERVLPKTADLDRYEYPPQTFCQGPTEEAIQAIQRLKIMHIVSAIHTLFG